MPRTKREMERKERKTRVKASSPPEKRRQNVLVSLCLDVLTLVRPFVELICDTCVSRHATVTSRVWNSAALCRAWTEQLLS